MLCQSGRQSCQVVRMMMYDGWSSSPATLLALTLEMHHFWVSFIAKLLSTLWTSSLEAGHELRVRQCHLKPSDITWDLFLVPLRDPKSSCRSKAKFETSLLQASDKQETGARTLRPKIKKMLKDPTISGCSSGTYHQGPRIFSKHAEVKTSHFNAMGLWDVSQHIYFPLRMVLGYHLAWQPGRGWRGTKYVHPQLVHYNMMLLWWVLVQLRVLTA